MIERRLDPWEYEPWMLDNGAYSQAAAQARARGYPSVDAMLEAGLASELQYDFDDWYEQLIASGELGWDRLPQIVVLPDRVGDGPRSLTTSLEWYHTFWKDFSDNIEDAETDGVDYDPDSDPLSETTFYLAVQPGIEPADLERPCPICGDWDNFPIYLHLSGILLGGTSRWKVANARRWRRWCRKRRLDLHYARAGTPAKVRFAMEVGVDSIDSAHPLWTEERFERFADVIQNGHPQLELFTPCALRMKQPR